MRIVYLASKRAILLVLVAITPIIGSSQTFVKSWQKSWKPDISNLTALNSKLLFTVTDDLYGKELWISDGSSEGTKILKDIEQGTSGSNPSNLIRLGNQLFFIAYTKSNGQELWVTDGTEANTRIVKEISKSLDINTNSSSPSNLTIVGDELYFLAKDDNQNYEIWKTDGSEEGTLKMTDFNSNWYPYVSNLVNYQGKLHFIQYQTLKRLDEETGILQEIFTTEGISIGHLKVSGDKLFFLTFSTYYQEINLYVLTNGTSPPDLLKSFVSPTYGSLEIANLTDAFGNLYFSLRSDGSVQTDELWLSDGTSDGTKLVKSFPWKRHSYRSEISEFLAYKNLLYFRSGEEGGFSLWKSDGTDKGTIQVKAIGINTDEEGSKGIVVFNNKLYFQGSELNYDGELWESDGSAEGTLIFSNINLKESSNPSYLTDVDGTLFFVASDGKRGEAIWTNVPAPNLNIQYQYRDLVSGDKVEFNSSWSGKIDSTISFENTGKADLIVSKISQFGDFFASKTFTILRPSEKVIIPFTLKDPFLAYKDGIYMLESNDDDDSLFVMYLSSQEEWRKKVTIVTGGEEEPGEDELVVFPNPILSDDVLNVLVKGFMPPTSITITDLNGSNINVPFIGSSKTIQISTAYLTTGINILRVVTSGKVITKKIIRF